MTDLFALLDQRGVPGLIRKRCARRFTNARCANILMRRRPAADGSSADADFARINEAFQTLSDPKLRLQHLLALAGHASTSRFDSVPANIADLFPAIAQVTQDATRVADKATGATSALSRSLLTGEIVQVRNRISALLSTLTKLQAEADAELQQA
jgi:DnaJ-domain-containing protein 1